MKTFPVERLCYFLLLPTRGSPMTQYRDISSQRSSETHYQRTYWRANKALIRNLLIVWALVSIVMSILLVEPLNSFQIGGVPFGFWMAQQGSIYVFVALIFIYAVQMDRLDRKYKKSAQESSVLSENQTSTLRERV